VTATFRLSHREPVDVPAARCGLRLRRFLNSFAVELGELDRLEVSIVD
jgi:hypothetical protein